MRHKAEDIQGTIRNRQPSKNLQDSIRIREQSAVLDLQHNRGRIRAHWLPQMQRRPVALQRGKPENTLSIPFQQPAHDTVAQGTVTIVEENRISVSNTHITCKNSILLQQVAAGSPGTGSTVQLLYMSYGSYHIEYIFRQQHRIRPQIVDHLVGTTDRYHIDPEIGPEIRLL